MGIFDFFAERKQRRDEEYARWLEEARAGEYSYEEEEARRFDDPEVLMNNLRRDMRCGLITEEEFNARRTEIWRAQKAGESGESVEFVYYTDARGFRRVDVVATNAKNGRELGEYEIYTEQLRLEKEDAETLPDESERQGIPLYEPYERPVYPETLPLEELGGLSAAKQAETDGDKEYQLRQLERWLEAGLIDKAEYRRRKREMK